MLSNQAVRGLALAARAQLKVKLPQATGVRSRQQDQGSGPAMAKSTLAGEGPLKTGAAGSATTADAAKPKKTAAVPSTPSPINIISRPISNKMSGEGAGSGKGAYKPNSRGLNPTDLSPYEVEGFLKAKTFDDIPGPTGLPALPFAGTRLLFLSYLYSHKLENSADLMNRLQTEFGPIFKAKLGSDWIVVIEDIQEMQHVAKKAGLEKARGVCGTVKTDILGKLPKTVEDPVAFSVLHGDGANLKDVYQAIVTTTSNEISSSVIKNMDKVAKDFVKLIETNQGNATAIQELFFRMSFETMSSRMMNKRLGLLSAEFGEDKQKLLEAYQTEGRCLGEESTGGRLLHRLFEDPFGKRFKEAKKLTTGLERELMHQAVTKLRDPNCKGEEKDVGLLTGVLENRTLSDSKATEYMHSVTVLYGNMMANSLQMLLCSLATNEDKQEKLVAELQKNNFAINTETIMKKDYLSDVLLENLRLNFPVATGGGIVLDSNIVINDYLVPAGTSIHLNTARTALSPLLFDHPQRFVPERWQEAQTKQIPPILYLPIALAENPDLLLPFFATLKPAVIKILKNFRVDLPGEFHKTKAPTVNTPFLGPKAPLPFTFTPRAKSAAPEPAKKSGNQPAPPSAFK